MSYDMKMPGFRQTVKEFFTTKTNLAALASIVATYYGYHIGYYDYGGLVAGVSIAAGAITFRDTLKGME